MAMCRVTCICLKHHIAMIAFLMSNIPQHRMPAICEQAELPKVSRREAAEQELREAYLNAKLARKWAGGAAWAAVDFLGVALTGPAAAVHLSALPQVRHWPTVEPVNGGAASPE